MYYNGAKPKWMEYIIMHSLYRQVEKVGFEPGVKQEEL